MRFFKVVVPFAVAVGCVAGGPVYDSLQGGEIETLRYGLGAGAFDFCAQGGTVSSVDIERADGGYTISGTYQSPGETDEDGVCLEQNQSGECYVVDRFGPSPLAVEEVRVLEELLLEIETKHCREDQNIACDVCVIPTITVNGKTEDSFCCGDVNDDFSEPFRAAEARIKALGLTAYQAEAN